MKEALLYEKIDGQMVRCFLCHHHCRISTGKRGRCGVRENRGGRLDTLVYGRVVASHVDPIEKKPLFHLLPGSRSFSIATVGCNFTCRFCQNADIAQLPENRNGLILGEKWTPSAVVREAQRAGCRSIAYTYTEPTVFFEFALDCARIAKEQGLFNVFVTNGYMTPEALTMISPFLDAANVDLKAYSEVFYKQMCGAKLEPVKETLRRMSHMGVLVEVTTLIVPGANDDLDDLGALADFLCRELGPDTPWHISRFHPTYRLTDRRSTPVDTLRAARRIGLEAGLRYVYLGNVPGSDGENTFCRNCGNIVINRFHYNVRQNLIDGNRCAYCHEDVHGIF
ncbi:MAG: AmmeMemoRadiSam system radical SAM enzyme [Desulfobacterales bacterium]|jgi:pyruvate formate lyase activating enzyme